MKQCIKQTNAEFIQGFKKLMDLKVLKAIVGGMIILGSGGGIMALGMWSAAKYNLFSLFLLSALVAIPVIYYMIILMENCGLIEKNIQS